MTCGYYKYSPERKDIPKLEDLEFSYGAQKVYSLKLDDGRSPGMVFMAEIVQEGDTVVVPTLGELYDKPSELINVLMISIAHKIPIVVICGIDGVGFCAHGWECLVLSKLFYIMECQGLLIYK